MPKPAKRKVADTIRFNAEGDDRSLRRFASLLVVQGAEADLGQHVRLDRPTTLGRDPDVELPLRDGSTSRRHCRVERDEVSGEFIVRDLGSTNGTKVNGARVDGTHLLAPGDKIFLGASVVKFHFTDDIDAEYHQKLDAMVGTDGLTGLLSRRRFDAAFAAAAEAARADGTALAVLVMDMDGLKQINDAHGHDVGGFAITEVARQIRAVLTGHGETCRYGGDEFVAFLPSHGKSEAVALAERIRDRVDGDGFARGGVVVRPTISIGVAAAPDDGDQAEALFRAADAALYRAKAAGKNQVKI
jgi:diguanylate cyclase (GGDEF)-like protein